MLDENNPCLDTCIFSLLPKTLGLLPKGFMLDQHGPDPVQNLLRSMVLNDPVGLLDQATKVLNSNPELLKSDFACHLPSQVGDLDAIANGEGQPPRRRPALGHKWAQFSFKPGQSEPTSQVDPSFNIDNLQDPDEFFAAFERLESNFQETKVLNTNPELLKSDFACQLPSQVSDGDAIANGEGQPTRRRPALGRKRAQFSFKPGQSEPSSQADPSLNIHNLQDPDEFFAAFEKFENAEKELKKLRGETSTEPIHPHNSIATRPRRPGILGRRANYKHLYPAPADNMGNLALSKIPPPSKSTSDLLLEATDGFGASEEKENTGDELLAVSQEKGSVAEMESRIGSVLDELLYTCKDLGGDETVNLLQEKLNIKPLSLDKLSLPDLSSVQINDHKASHSRFRKSFSVLQQSIKAMIRRKTPVKDSERVESPTFSKTSPTPSRSPFSLIPTLQRRISQLNPTIDPFSIPLDFDMSPVEHSTVEGVGHNLSPPIDITGLSTNGHAASEKIDVQRLSFSGKLPAPMLEGDNSSENNINSPKLLTEESAFPVEKPTSDNSNRFDGDMDVTPNGLDTSLQDKVKNMLPEPSASQEPDICLEGLTIETANSSGNQSDHPSPIAETFPPVGGHSENSSISSKQHNEEPASILPNKRTEQKTATRRGSKRAELSRRQSLAGAGTSWKSGVRRSNRIKTRPLEYWRGERFLFGRIHDTLPTVIGVKRSSPSSKEPVLKVKSFVHEKYAELVENAALH